MSNVFPGLTAKKSVSLIWWEVKMEDVRYIICNLFRGLKKKSNLQLLLENILITKTLCADIFKAPKHEIPYREGIYNLKSRYGF